MEAQRISLSQIHAAQLELLKERLPEWEESEKQGRAKGNCMWIRIKQILLVLRGGFSTDSINEG